jgi:serine/threonine protein kinase
MKEEDIKGIPPSGKPMISSRLPKAFSQPKHLTHKKNHEHKDISAVNEYKNIKKLLSPLKQSSPKSAAFRKAIHKLANFPLANGTNLPNLHIEKLLQSNMKLEEMITLSIIKSSYSSGIVRKSLHAPSCQLYATKEIPVNTRETRQKLLETLKAWQKVQRQARYIVEVSSSFWNSPEGCVTIVMEYMPGDSLAKLCECIGAVPEKLLRSIAKRVLTALSYLHKKSGAHGAVNMSHIMFNREGKCKLGIGLSSKLTNKEEGPDSTSDLESDIYSFGNTLISASLGCSEWITDITPSECCLFHDCLSIQGLPYLSRLTDNFKNFLCGSTNYTSISSINELISHPWIACDDVIGADVGIKDLLCMSLVGTKEFNLNVDKQINALLESLQVVLTGNQDVKNITPASVKELAMEYGLSTEVLYDKIIGIIKNN